MRWKDAREECNEKSVGAIVHLGRVGAMERVVGVFTRRLSSVRRTATPASTLPTVREMSIVIGPGRQLALALVECRYQLSM